jgi:hypothetical protein
MISVLVPQRAGGIKRRGGCVFAAKTQSEAGGCGPHGTRTRQRSRLPRRAAVRCVLLGQNTATQKPPTRRVAERHREGSRGLSAHGGECRRSNPRRGATLEPVARSDQSGAAIADQTSPARPLRRRYATQTTGAASVPWVETHGYRQLPLRGSGPLPVSCVDNTQPPRNRPPAASRSDTMKVAVGFQPTAGVQTIEPASRSDA